MTKVLESSSKSIIENIKSLEAELLVILTEPNVWQIYKKDFPIDKIEGKKVIFYQAPSGESCKNIEEYSACVEFLLMKGVHRKAHLIAFGGGALSDFGGFVAATFLRGLSWSVIPTSLLSMVDAGIGGKVAINSKNAKNQMGAFHSPKNIWLNPQFLSSLPEQEVLSGKGEICKYCFLNEDIYKLVISSAKLETIIKACSDHKLDITNEDFKENGVRMSLNLGHTIGHALEKIYSLPHGIAVFWGLALVFILFDRRELLNELKKIKEHLNIPVNDSPWKNKRFPYKEVMDLVGKDKKRQEGSSIRFVLVKKIGEVEYQDLTLNDIEEKLRLNDNDIKKLTL